MIGGQCLELGTDTESYMIEMRQSAFIARSVGIVAIASGFALGMYGLDHPDSVWLRTSLGLITTGLLAQGYALYCAIQRIRKEPRPPRQ